MPGTDIKDIWYYANNILRSSRMLVNEGLKPLKLGSSEGNILLHLFTRDDDVNQEKIVEGLDISKPAVSRAIKSLEKKGYIRRYRDDSDRRSIRVRLTEKALDTKPRVEEVYNEVFAVAAQNVSQEEALFFIKLFSRVSDNFSRARVGLQNRGEVDVVE